MIFEKLDRAGEAVFGNVTHGHDMSGSVGAYDDMADPTIEYWV